MRFVCSVGDCAIGQKTEHSNFFIKKLLTQLTSLGLRVIMLHGSLVWYN